jgi:hypothetical protein
MCRASATLLTACTYCQLEQATEQLVTKASVLRVGTDLAPAWKSQDFMKGSCLIPLRPRLARSEYVDHLAPTLGYSLCQISVTMPVAEPLANLIHNGSRQDKRQQRIGLPSCFNALVLFNQFNIKCISFFSPPARLNRFCPEPGHCSCIPQIIELARPIHVAPTGIIDSLIGKRRF